MKYVLLEMEEALEVKLHKLLIRKIPAMKRTFKSILGVTLLEIMLVMAIAAMVIVMSIRYYQSAASNQRVASGVDILTGYVGAAVSYIQAGGTFSGISSANLKVYLPGNEMPASPWGGSTSIASGATNFTVNFTAVPASDCAKLKGLLTSNKSIVVTCTGTSLAAAITP